VEVEDRANGIVIGRGVLHRMYVSIPGPMNNSAL
jgi:hypothetical protein